VASQRKVRSQGEALSSRLWIAIVVISALFGFAAGYGVSLRTGIEPGYFEAPEAGGYGVAPSGPKMSEELKKYYEGLAK
jgi:hypothetical protein